jgi:hypothetical protein
MDHEWLKSMPGLRKEPNDLAEGVNITFLIIYCCLFLISIYKCALFLFKARYDLAVIIGANIIALIGKYLTSLFNFSLVRILTFIPIFNARNYNVANLFSLCFTLPYHCFNLVVFLILMNFL